MKCTLAEKSFNIILKVKSVGDGYWDLGPDVVITSTRLWVEVRQYDDDPLIGTARFEHDCNAYTHGLIYTDSAEVMFFKFLEEHPELGDIVIGASGSEQGMQGQFVLDMDLDIKDNVTFDMLERYGFKVTKETF